MAITANWYGRHFQWLYNGSYTLDWTTPAGEKIYTALYTNAATFNPDADVYRSTYTSGEVSGTGYTAGGSQGSNTAVTIDTTNNQVVLDMNDVNWTSSTISAYRAIVYSTSGNSTTDPLISYVDFDGTYSTSAGTFTVQWAASGVAFIDYQ